MRVRVVAVLSLVVFVSVAFVGSVFAPPFKYKTGLVTNNAPLVNPGEVIYSGQDGNVYLIGQDGSVVRRWRSPIPGQTLAHPKALDNGNILAWLDEDGPGRAIIEIGQGGNQVWTYSPPTATIEFHHDHQRLENGNTLILCADFLTVPSISPDEIEDDCLLEVDPAGTVVWEWHTWEHFDDFGFSPEIAAMISDHAGDWAHANSASAIPSDTSHTDPRFRPGNIIISYRFINLVVVVDRDTGDIVWKSDGLTIGQHDAHMLPDSLPGRRQHPGLRQRPRRSLQHRRAGALERQFACRRDRSGHQHGRLGVFRDHVGAAVLRF